MSSPPKSNIILYTDQTPNGIKISIALEELGLVSLNHHHKHSLASYHETQEHTNLYLSLTHPLFIL